MKDTAPILVIGSTGKTGRRVATKLEALGQPVRHGSRSAAIPFDWEDPSTWAPALAGARFAYVTYYPDLAVPGSQAAIGNFVAIAKAAGLQRIVLLDGRNAHVAHGVERALGRPPRDFADFAKSAAATGVWAAN